VRCDTVKNDFITVPRRAERQASGVPNGAGKLPRPCCWTGRGKKKEEVDTVTAATARRIWEVLLKIRDEEKGEHDTIWEVTIHEKRNGRPVRIRSKKGNSPLAI